MALMRDKDGNENEEQKDKKRDRDEIERYGQRKMTCYFENNEEISKKNCQNFTNAMKYCTQLYTLTSIQGYDIPNQTEKKKKKKKTTAKQKRDAQTNK